jgi:RNA polymerase sigma-70 factor (ECF subfamily)
MECGDKAPNSAARTSAQFATTHWSTVLAAGESASPGASEALEKLCRTYWLPVFVFVRHQGYAREPAEDLTQGFFEQLIEKELASRADPERGRFRNFLLKVLTQFLTDERRRDRALKRGGDTPLLPLDRSLAEERLASETEPSPEIAFARKWALTVLDKVLALLKQESEGAGKAAVFEALSPYLQGEHGLPHYAEVARQLGMTESAVKVGVHRMRLRYRELLRAVVAQTVADPSEIDDEIRFLFQVLSR